MGGRGWVRGWGLDTEQRFKSQKLRGWRGESGWEQRCFGKQSNPAGPNKTVQPGRAVVIGKHLRCYALSVGSSCPQSAFASELPQMSHQSSMSNLIKRLIRSETRANLFLSIRRCSQFHWCFGRWTHNSVLCPVKLAIVSHFSLRYYHMIIRTHCLLAVRGQGVK